MRNLLDATSMFDATACFVVGLLVFVVVRT
jgi:hypothetical protein